MIMKEPKIRFKGFSGEWKETIFGDSVIINSGMDYKHLSVGEIPVYGTGGYMLSVNESLSDIDAIGIGRKGTIDKPQLLKAPFWTVDTLFFMTPKNGDNLNFLFALSQKTNWRKYDESTGVPSLSKVNIAKIAIALPKKKEQIAIASYFQHLDILIQSTTKKIESLKQVKSASLQSMFPQEGATKPRVRFNGFEGEWEKMAFGNVFEFIKNNSLSRDQLSYTDGVVKNIHYGDVLIKFGDIIDISKDRLPYIKSIEQKSKMPQTVLLQDGDVIIADAAEDNTVGKCSEILNVNDECVVAGLHTIPCRPMIPFALGYLGYYINSDLYHNQLLPLIQGSKISSISKSVIKLTTVVFPSIAEQQQIADYFTSLDTQITLQTQRLEKLKQIKSACLDNMFV